jgi:hypothetical protein
MDRTRELEEELRRLTQMVAEMRARMARSEGRRSSTDAESNHSGRRGFLRLGAGALLGALGWAAVKAVPASAATNGSLVLGNPNLAENPTTLVADGGTPPVQVLGVEAAGTTWNPPIDGTFVGPLQGLGADGGEDKVTAVDVDGVNGWARGVRAAGVYGLTNSGYGVIGESNSGVGLYARTSGRIQQEALLLPGAPTYQPGLFEQVRDSDGVLWIHNGSGVWRRVNTMRADTADGLGGAFKPFRRLDTRSGAIKAAGSLTVVSIAGQGSGASAIPADAIAAVGNLTATAYTGGGFLAIMPAGITVGTGAGQFNPASDPSTVNFQVGQSAIANAFVCGLSGGALQVYVAGHSSHFIVDITAYIQ